MRQHRLAPLWIFLAFLLLAAATVYFVGVYYFRSHFLFQTTFLGADVSQQTVDAIDAQMEAESLARNLTIRKIDGTTEVLQLAPEIDYRRTVTVPPEGWIPEALSWRWPQSLFAPTELPAEEHLSYSQEKLSEAVSALDALDPDNVTEPQDAYIQWDEGICYIVPEVDGNKLYPERVYDAVKAAIDEERDTVDLAAEDCYYRATIKRDDEGLKAYVRKYEAINFQQIVVDVVGKELVLSSDNILSFYYESNPDNDLDSEEIAKYAAHLKEEYDTYERQRPFTDHYGNYIMVGTWADTYGFKMDLDATIAVLTEALESRTSMTVFPVWTNMGLTRGEDGSDIGNTYIEISIGEQHLWAYVDGAEVLSTDVVTGNLGNHDTPRGVFRIISKAQNTYLTGPDYRSFVNYWMQLTWGGVGLHDASWRSYYGGNIYTYNGSHGCINMPYWAVEQAYGMFSAGMPVVIW